MNIKLAVLGMFTAVAAFAADTAPISFNAVLSMGQERRFGLATEGGAHSAWVTLGNDFEGYKLKAYEPATQVLTVEKDGKEFTLPIAGGTIQTLDTKATIAQATDVLNRMKFEQMLGKMIEQQKQATVNMSKQMMAGLGGKVPPEEFAAFQAKIMDALWSEMKVEELKGEVAKIYSDVFTAEELRGLSDFYATPSGIAMIDKQPVMQQRMMEVMMPRMMKAMPKIQALGQQFAQEQAAKSQAGQAATAAPAKASAPAPAPAPKPQG